MIYHHHLFHKFDDCSVSVAFVDAADWRQLAETPVRQFQSLMAAAEYILNQQHELQFVVVTAHSTAGAVDLSQDELGTLVALVQSIRNCQD